MQPSHTLPSIMESLHSHWHGTSFVTSLWAGKAPHLRPGDISMKIQGICGPRPAQWFSKCGSRSSSLSITWGLDGNVIKNAIFRSQPRSTGSKTWEWGPRGNSLFTITNLLQRIQMSRQMKRYLGC